MIDHERYRNFILPKKVFDINLKDTINILYWMFSEKTPLFNTCWKCLNKEKNYDEDIIIYVGRVKREWTERFKLDKLTQDFCKCHIFAQGFIAKTDAEVRMKILAKLEMN